MTASSSIVVPVVYPSPYVDVTPPEKPKFSALPDPTVNVTIWLDPCVVPAEFFTPEVPCLLVALRVPATFTSAPLLIVSVAVLLRSSRFNVAPIPFLPTFPQLRNSFNPSFQPLLFFFLASWNFDPDPTNPLSMRSIPKSI